MRKITFYASPKEYELGLAKALLEGAKRHGFATDLRDTASFTEPDKDTHIAAVMGVKGHSKRIVDAYYRSGRQYLLVDKGYVRQAVNGGPKHFRITADASQAGSYVMGMNKPSDRWQRLGVEMKPMRRHAMNRILIAGSSQKYCEYHNLGDATAYAERIASRLRKILPDEALQIVYRPKPSWVVNHPDEVKPIPRTIFSGPKTPFAQELMSASAVVSHGSIALVEALCAGIPVVALGDSIAGPLSTTELKGIVAPKIPEDHERFVWANNLAYCQFTLAEMEGGFAWDVLKERLYATGPGKNASSWSEEDQLIHEYRIMHQNPKRFRGTGMRKHIGTIRRLIVETGSRSLLDYGSGKGEQYIKHRIHRHWKPGGVPKCYDPGVPGLDEPPEDTFDGVLCSDVLEHVPESAVDATLDRIFAYARKFVFLSISTVKANKTLPGGENCHVTVKPPGWWDARIKPRATASGVECVTKYSDDRN